MINRFPSPVVSLSLALAFSLVAGCASKSPAPVEDRSSALSSASAPSGPGYHSVRKGETLYSIALEYGQDYREVAGWNNITDPNRIMVGQTLRVLPPGQTSAEPTASVSPVTTGSVVEQRPLEGAVPATVVAAGGALKREPRASKEPYSDAALARLQNPTPATPAAPAPAPAAAPTAATETAVATAPAAAAASAAQVSGTGETTIEGVVWSWPATGNIVGNFAQTKGVDIAGKAGDPVLAAADGKVVYSGSGLRGYGQLVIIKHNATFLSAYAHNQKILVKEGQNVKRGQRIAEMGKTDSTSVKLHFEVRRQGKPVEPLNFLPKR